MIARPMLASMFLVAGYNSLKHAHALAPAAKPVNDRIRAWAEKRLPVSVPGDVALVRINGAAHVGAGAMLATGRMPRLSALVLASTLVPTTLAGHRFWEEQDPQARAEQQFHFFKNVSMMGGLLIASRDLEGRPGLAWRTKHAAHDARLQAKAVLPV
jgi:uncharacterized membrane protein YphA (DoxX/SURF4 family)